LGFAVRNPTSIEITTGPMHAIGIACMWSEKDLSKIPSLINTELSVDCATFYGGLTEKYSNSPGATGRFSQRQRYGGPAVSPGRD
jgi:hypothetical protein